MSYQALARKYRPGTFAEVVGQEHVTGTLRAALRQDKLSHAYLFSGPRGCGKTTVARLLAKALNCEQGSGDDPCGRCETCRSIADGTWLDVLEIDAASHTGVDNIRELRDMAQYTPTKGANKVFIIDEVHMLSKGAFNALLKILEEPPARVFFFFATTEPNRIPRTILSRCQRFDFRLLSREELTARLEEICASENVKVEPAAMRLVVTQAEGSMRDAQSVLDQVLAACEGDVTEQRVVELFGLVGSEVFSELNEAVLAGDPARALKVAEKVVTAGQNLDDFAQGLVNNFRHLMLLKVDPTLAAGISLPDEQIQALTRQSEKFATQDLLAYLDRAALAFERIRRSSQPRVHLEAALVDLALMESRVLLADLVRRVQALSGGGPAPAAPASGGAGAGPRRGRGTGPADSAAPAGESARSRPAPPAAAQAGPAAPAAGEEELPAGHAAAETVPGWASFIDSLMQSAPGLGSCLLDAIPAFEGEDRLVLSCPAAKAFQLDRIRNELPVLEAKVRERFGRKVVLNVIDGDDDPDAGRAREEHREAIRRRVAPSDQEELNAACREDSTLAGLVDMLDGEAVPSAQVPEWIAERRRRERAAGDEADDHATGE